MLTNSATPLQKAEEQIRLPQSVQKLVAGARSRKKRRLFKATNLLPIQRDSNVVKKNKMTLTKFSRLFESNNKDSFEEKRNSDNEKCTTLQLEQRNVRNSPLEPEILSESRKNSERSDVTPKFDSFPAIAPIVTAIDTPGNSTTVLLEQRDVRNSPLEPVISSESRKNLEGSNVTPKFDSFPPVAPIVTAMDDSISTTDHKESEDFGARCLSNDTNNDHRENEGIANQDTLGEHENTDERNEYSDDRTGRNSPFENIVNSAMQTDHSDNQNDNDLLVVENEDENFPNGDNFLVEKATTPIKSSMKSNGSNATTRKKWVTFNDLLESQGERSLVDKLYEKIEDEPSDEEKTKIGETNKYDENSCSVEEPKSAADDVADEREINAGQIRNDQILEMIVCVQEMNEILSQFQNEILEWNIPEEEEEFVDISEEG